MKKNKILLKIIIISTILIFIGIAIVVIIISRGGLITKQGIVDTGVIRIEVSPKDASFNVYINDEATQLVDKRINNLTAGVYNIKIESSGYSSWEKDVKVISGVVNEVYVKLIPQKFSLEQITKTNIDKAFFSSNGEYIYYVVKNTEIGQDKGIWRMKLTQSQLIFGNNENESQKIVNIIPEVEMVINDSDYQLLSSNDNKRLLVFNSKSKLAYIFDAEKNNEKSEFDLVKTLGFYPQKIYWFNGSRSLIIQDGNLLFEHILDTNIDTLIKYSKDKELIFGLNNSLVYLLNNNQTNQISSYSSQTKKEIKLVNNSLPQNISQIITSQDNNNIFIIKTDKNYVYINLDKSIVKELLSVEYELRNISNQGKSMIFYKGNEIYSLNLKEILATNTIDTTLNKIELSSIDNLQILNFSPSSTHFLIYSPTNSNLVIYENDGMNRIELLNNQIIKNNTFGINKDSSGLYILLNDETTGENEVKRANLYRIDLEKPE